MDQTLIDRRKIVIFVWNLGRLENDLTRMQKNDFTSNGLMESMRHKKLKHVSYIEQNFVWNAKGCKQVSKSQKG